MGQLDGKITWVTGAGSGIGEAAALMLAREGATVVLSGRRREPLEDVKRRIESAGGTATAMPGDLTDSSTVEAIGAEIARQFGRLDILVNNAGVNIQDRNWDRLTPEGIDTLLRGNLTAAIYCARVALNLMRPKRSGSLIHTASTAGRLFGSVGGVIYSAAKHGVVAISHDINVTEGKNGIRSCVICPGEVDTPILVNRPQPVSAEARAKLLTADDVADVIRYVACLPNRVRIDDIMMTPTRF